MISAEELNSLVAKAAKDSIMHGYKDNEHPIKRILVKAACEVSEALTAKRYNRTCSIEDLNSKISLVSMVSDGGNASVDAKVHEVYKCHMKDTVQDEMSDVMIYLMVCAGHFCGKFTDTQIDVVKTLMNHFENMLIADGDFVMRAGTVMEYILGTYLNSQNILSRMALVEVWFKCENNGESIWPYVVAKMKYNLKRPYLHGVKNDNTI